MTWRLAEAPLELVTPAYGGGSLCDLLPSVLAALGVGNEDPLGLATGPLTGVRRVAVLLIDGLGWHQLPLAAPHAPILADLFSGALGNAQPLTAAVPSTTPTSLVSFGTGAAPGEHGVLGFTLRIPGTSRVLNHIDWSDDPEPGRWQPVPTRFAIASAAGVAASVASRPEFEGTGLTVAAYGGASHQPATTVDEIAGATLSALAAGERGAGAPPVLAYGYYSELDKTGHVFGVASQEWVATVGEVDRLVTMIAERLPPGSALVVTADHGLIDIPVEGRLDLDADPRLMDGVEVVAGEARTRYLYAKPGAADDVLAAWRGLLGPAALVVTREEAVAAGWFGPVRREHLARIGDVVVACRGRHVVLATAREPERVAAFAAFHGSLTAAEMMIPLLVIRSPSGAG